MLRRRAQAVEAAKKRLSVVRSVNVTLPVAPNVGGATSGGAAAADSHGGDAADAGGTAADAVGAQSGDGSLLCVELSRGTLERLCDDLLRRLKTPLYEVALSARVTLPGELDPDHGVVRKKDKAKVRKAKAKLRPEGRQKYCRTSLSTPRAPPRGPSKVLPHLPVHPPWHARILPPL